MDAVKRAWLVWMIPAVLLLTRCGERASQEVRLEGRTMGTTWHLTLVPGTSNHNEKNLQQTLQGRLDELNFIFSNWRNESPVSRFNESHSIEWQAVPVELAQMVVFAKELNEKTGGRFDITIAPLVDLWGFGAKGRVSAAPSEEAIATGMKHVHAGMLEVRLDPPALRKNDPELCLNVSAMADGFAVDDLTKRLHDSGEQNFLLEIGGGVYASGVNAQHQPWQVGIQQPHAASGETVASMPLRNQAMSTAGVYRQYFEQDGRRYAHILDAITGRPVEHRLESVTVIADKCFIADGWDTSLLILGPEQGRVVAKDQGLSAFFLEGR